ncbi:MAG: [Clostridia bacterium]|nr:[FeFe] hydrogenase, group A [Clostridia bacterium]
MIMVNIKINDVEYQVPENITVLEACRYAGIRIPTLCYLKDINQIGACRICVVEVKGARSLVAACTHPINEGMEIYTNSPAVRKSRKMSLELILSTHEKKCLSCVRSQNCELQTLAAEFGCDETAYEGEREEYPLDTSTEYLIRDNNKCILCRRCVAACKNQHVGVIGANERGFKTHIATAFELGLKDVPCVACGQCIAVCPVGALREKDEIDNVLEAINNPEKHVVVATAPAVRVAIGEEFGYPVGTNTKGKMVTALKKLGFDKVFDVNFTADLTIMEEGTEFLERLSNGGTLPMITSCSPGWVKFCEHYYPELLPNLSSCKSPQQMFGAVIKTYYAEKNGIDPKDIYMVSVMPCTAKKFEKTRDDQAAAGVADIDAVLTTRELARMIKRAGIMYQTLSDEEFDNPLGVGTGAGVIFGATGGVMEAALRTVAEIVDKKELENLEFTAVRGVEGIKEASYTIGGNEVKVAVASGLSNAKILMDKIKNGECDYHFIEIMGCPGGCVNGGGQPIVPADIRNVIDIRAVRAASIYEEDKNLPIRKSHENPIIKEIYADYFEKPGSHKAHDALHTKYVKRDRY